MDVPDHLPALIINFQLLGDQIGVVDAHLGLFDILGVTSAALIKSPNLLLKAIKNMDFSAKINNALLNQVPFHAELEIRDSTGVIRWLHCAFSLSTKACGSACLMDVTEHHNIFMQEQKKTQFFVQMQNQLEDLFYVKDRQSKIVDGNKAFYQYHGASGIDELIGTTDLDSKRIPDADKRSIFDAEQLIVKKGCVLRKREQSWDEFGGEHFYESIKTPFKDDDGNVIGLVGITREITDQVRSEQALELAKNEAELASKAKSTFLAVMSHEIRTPMNGVLGCASLLANTHLDESQRQYVRTIRNSGDALLLIINDILDYSKIEAGKFELDNCEFEINDVVEYCLDLFGKSAVDKQLEINALIDNNVPRTFIGDPARLRQVLCNLVSNAIKFTAHGEILINVEALTIDKQASSCKLVIKVKDTGIGIAEDKQEKLFEAFTQADNSVTRKYGGTGLGLVICKKLVQLMGGDIRFDSEPYLGTTFSVTLTLQYTETKPKPELQRIAKSLSEKNALIVDDNATNRMVLESLCHQYNISTVCMNEAESTLEYLSDLPNVDLILLDFCMPNSHGGELAIKIKNINKYKATPIILLSSIHAPQEFRADVDLCLLKPVASKRLVEAMYFAVSGKPKNLLPETFTIFTPNKTRVLIAEDNPVNQMVLCSMLKKLNYQNITTVENGVLALEQLQKENFELIFMDMQMPLMDGMEATRKIRELPNGDKPWIIALTAGALKEDETQAYQAGVSAFTPKPITLESLQEALSLAESLCK